MLTISSILEWMDQHVNKKFASTLAVELADDGKTFLDLGTCPLHPVYTALRYGIKELSFDLDEFFNDVHFFFKNCQEGGLCFSQ